MLWHQTIKNNKPPLTLLHGLGFNADVFKPILKQYTQSYQITLVDLPGHGRSPMIEGHFDNWVDAILPFVAEKGRIVGWSLGGLLAIQLASLKSLHQLHLIASSPCFINKKNWHYGIDKNNFKKFQKNLSNEHSKGLENFIRLQFIPKIYLNAILLSVKQYPAKLAALKYGLDILCTTDLRETIKQLSSVTTITLGKKDTLVSAKISTWYQHNHINCRLTSGGHLPFLQAEFNNE